MDKYWLGGFFNTGKKTAGIDLLCRRLDCLDLTPQVVLEAVRGVLGSPDLGWRRAASDSVILCEDFQDGPSLKGVRLPLRTGARE